jgi:predicted acylesterase/phospholipase RssA
MIPYRIYLSGGGICAIGHVGALVELANHIPLKAVKEWMGVSAGSLVAMCLSIGFTLDELYDICIRFDFTNIKEMDSVPGWLLRFGLDTGERLHRLIEACLHVKGLDSDITFKECYDRFGKSLRVIATDVNEASAIIFSPEDTPDYNISNAVRASMTFPYYFQPFICPKTGHYLIDGGVISNYPLFILPKKEHNRTLSLLIRTEIEKKEDLTDLEIDRFISRPLNIALNEKIKHEMQYYDTHCIQIKLGQLNILDFSFDEKTKEFIIRKGKEAVQEYIKTTTKTLQRRNSL